MFAPFYSALKSLRVIRFSQDANKVLCKTTTDIDNAATCQNKLVLTLIVCPFHDKIVRPFSGKNTEIRLSDLQSIVFIIGNPHILRQGRIWFQFFTDSKPEFGQK